MGGSEDDIDAFKDDSGIRRRSAIDTYEVDTYEVEEGMTMRIKVNRIVPLVAVGAAAVAIAAAPTAAATTVGTGSTVNQTPGNAQITAVPGAAAQHAAQLQQPFGGDMGALLFHH